MNKEGDCMVGSTCGVTVSEEVGKDGMNSVSRKTHRLGESAGSPSVREIKNVMVDKTTKRKQRCLAERQGFEGSPVGEFSLLRSSRK